MIMKLLKWVTVAHYSATGTLIIKAKLTPKPHLNRNKIEHSGFSATQAVC